MLRLAGVSMALLAALVPGCTGPHCLGWGDADAVHRAAYRGNVKRLQRELDRGVSPDAPARIPEYDFKAGIWRPESTPLKLAVMGRRCDTIDVLLERGATPEKDLLQSIIIACPECLAGALARGVPPDTVNSSGWASLWGQPLHVAAAYDELRAARELLDAGADVNGRDDFGSTPLHDAASWGQVEMARFLIQAGADPLARDKWGRTPVTEARRMGPLQVKNQEAMLAVLREAIEASGRSFPEPPAPLTPP